MTDRRSSKIDKIEHPEESYTETLTGGAAMPHGFEIGQTVQL